MRLDPAPHSQGFSDQAPETISPTLNPTVTVEDVARMATAVSTTVNEVEVLKQRLNEQSQMMMQMMSVLRPPAYMPPAGAPSPSEPPPAQVLSMLRGGGFRFSGEADTAVLYPRSIDEWERKIRPMLGKKTWTLGDMISATLGYMHCRGASDFCIAHMVVCKIRDMGAAEYKTVFEEMVNSDDPIGYWEGLTVNTGPRMHRVVSGHPFSAPRSFSSGGEGTASAKAVSTKKEKK